MLIMMMMISDSDVKYDEDGDDNDDSFDNNDIGHDNDDNNDDTAILVSKTRCELKYY